MRVTAQRLVALGARIRFYKSRRLRATALLTDREFLLGSASLTSESPVGIEQGTSIRLFEATHKEQEKLFKDLWIDAVSDWNAGGEPGRSSRPLSAPASSP